MIKRAPTTLLFAKLTPPVFFVIAIAPVTLFPAQPVDATPPKRTWPVVPVMPIAAVIVELQKVIADAPADPMTPVKVPPLTYNAPPACTVIGPVTFPPGETQKVLPFATTTGPDCVPVTQAWLRRTEIVTVFVTAT